MNRLYFPLMLIVIPVLVACSVVGQPVNSSPASPHQDQPVMATPVDFGPASHIAVTSGNWSDPGTWQNRSLPADNAVVSIPMGQTIIVDGPVIPKLKAINIDGTLRFATSVNTQLNVDTLISSHHGRLEIGTEANPIASDVTAKIIFADLGEIDLSQDPKQLGRGAILGGPTVMYGAQKTHRITVASYPRAGDTSLHLSAAPSGWREGDDIIITGTQGSSSEEVRKIVAVTGSSITLDKALELDHIPPKNDLNLWVANITRNIHFESENHELGRRGHIMFHHTLNANIQNVAFYGLGRTDKTRPLDDFEYEFTDVPGNSGPSPIHFNVIEGPATNIRGRYAIHFHRGGNSPDTSPALVKGSVVVDVPGWGFVNHSSNVDFINNVSYKAQGAGFYTEVGDEIGSMVGNIAIRTVNSSFVLDDEGAIDPDLGLDLGDFGNDGDGFWLSGTRVSVIDNVAAGASAHGIIFWVDGLIEPDKGRGTVKVSDIANGSLITDNINVPFEQVPGAC